ncbi:trypsin-like peptidase domain-containing protein [Anaerolineales bacterium HSG6]|nr:trypsin-like peptidase domain-containing protein [Anaerolineales bacterium HSG6]
MFKIRFVFFIILMAVTSACNPITISGFGDEATPVPEATVPIEEATATPEPEPIEVVRQIPAPVDVVPTALPAETIAEADAEELLLINLYERVNPSVVNIFITVDGGGSMQHQLFPTQGQGSGFIYDDQGHIITNNHVVHGAKRLDVTFYDGTSVPAEIIGTDPASDLAVVKVDVPPESLRPVAWADSDLILVGQRAVAIGNPFGLKGSLTTGIISALGRSLPAAGYGYQIPEIVQTDAAINPGNSGGPLLNSQGEVVGVNTAIVPRQLGSGERSFLGVGFAVPANLTQRVVPKLIEDGEYRHPWLGLVGQDVRTEIAAKMKLPTATGAFITEVISGGPADLAGLRAGAREVVLDNGLNTKIGGDVIIAVDDEEVRTFSDIVSYLSRRGVVDENITITYIREGEERMVEVTIQARPSDEDLD